MSNNLVSIIIPTYNRIDLLFETLKSIQNQLYRDFECLVIDDGSTNVTAIQKFIKFDNRFKFYERLSTHRTGPNACRNYGFEKAKGDFIYFFDSDDILKPNALTNYLAAFQTNIDVVIAPLDKVDATTRAFLESNTIYSENLVEDYFIGAVSFYVCGPLWRRSFLAKQSELFDESLRNLDDWDFNLRMWYAKPKAVFLDEPTVRYLQHDDSLKKELKKGNPAEIDSAFRARFKHLDLLTAQDPANKIKYERHIAFFYKKTLRNSLILKQPWREYYSALFRLLWKTCDFGGLLKLNFGVLGYKVFNKGYRFFE